MRRLICYLYVLLFAVLHPSLAWSSNGKRAGCNADNCARAVTGTFRGLTATASHHADCQSFQRCTVTPAPHLTTVTSTVVQSASTVTVTVGGAPVKSSTVTYITSLTGLPIPTTGSTNPAGSSGPVVTTSTTAAAAARRGVGGGEVQINLNRRAPPLKERVVPLGPVTNCPYSTPVYASACSGSARYASACSCWGVTKSTTTVSNSITVTIVSTTTVTTAGSTVVTITVSPTGTPIIVSTSNFPPPPFTPTSTSTSASAGPTHYFGIQVENGQYAGRYIQFDLYFHTGDRLISVNTTGTSVSYDFGIFYIDSSGYLHNNVTGSRLKYDVYSGGESYILVDSGENPLPCRIIRPLNGTRNLDCSNSDGYNYFRLCQTLLAVTVSGAPADLNPNSTCYEQPVVGLRAIYV